MNEVLQAAWATPHAAARMAERFGATPTPEQWRDAVLRIIAATAGEPARGVTRQSVRRSGIEWWLVEIGGVAVPVVYSPEAARIVTVLAVGRSGVRLRDTAQRRGVMRRRERVREEVWE